MMLQIDYKLLIMNYLLTLNPMELVILKDLIDICIEIICNKYFIDDDKRGHYKILEKYVHPISYKIMDWKEKNSLKIKKLIKN